MKIANIIIVLLCLNIELSFSQVMVDNDSVVVLQLEDNFKYLSDFHEYKSAPITTELLDSALFIIQCALRVERNSMKSVLYGRTQKKYKIQLIPLMKDNEFFVWANLFCESETDSEYWKKSLILVRDGGDCYLNMIVNISEMNYFNFLTN